MELQPRVRSWRRFADGVAITLGLNVWLSVVVLPALFIPSDANGFQWLAVMLPLPVLMSGLWRRSELLLLLLYPATILIPLAAFPAMVSGLVYGPVRFVTVAVGVAAYLVGVSFFTTFHEPTPPVSIRALSSVAAGQPPRWRRRERVYKELVALALVMPTTLLLSTSYAPGVQLYLAENYPGRVAEMTTVLLVGVIALWLAVFHAAFLGILAPHRTGDRDLVVKLARTSAQTGASRPRRILFVGVTIVIVGTLLLLLRQ